MSDRYGLGIESSDGYSPLSQLGSRFMADAPGVEAVAAREAQAARDAWAARLRNQARPVGGRSEGWLTEHPDFGMIVPRSPMDFALLALGGPFSRAVKTGALALGAALEPSEAEAGIANGLRKALRLYHGSRYDFDKFDLSKIGTGDGHQFFSHGLYFGEHPGVARHYRDDVTKAGFTVSDVTHAKRILNKFRGNTDNAMAYVDQAKASYSSEEMRNRMDRIRSVIENKVTRHPGRTYEVSIDAHPDQFPVWNKPLSEQHANVQPILRDVWDKLPESLRGSISDPTTEQIIKGLGAYRGGARAASEELNGLGIPGVKYLDKLSERAGEGTFNYVVYDDALIDILKKYGIAGVTAGPAAYKAAQPGPEQNEF